MYTGALLFLAHGAAAAVFDVPATPGALNEAVDVHALASPGPHTLRLAPGRHRLLRPLKLSAVHSGLHFHGSAEGSSIISGGLEIPPNSWMKFAPAACGGCGAIMRAPLAAGTNYSRQLYVDDVRANWTMALFPENASTTLTGYSLRKGSVNWKHNGGAKIEMVYRGTKSSGAQWTESRTPVIAVRDTLLGTHITMATDGFQAGIHKAYNQHLRIPEYVQNVYEMLGDAEHGRAGDFYLDLDANGKGFLYFVTEADSSTPIKAVLPQLELLVDASPGTKNLQWSGVTFAEATWLIPSTDVGFVEMQAGCTLRGKIPAGHKDWYDDSTWTPTTANVLLVGVSGAKFDGCTFTRLGACGVSFEGGAQNNSVSHSSFVDISASAVSIGRTNTYNISDPTQQDANNVISDCSISRVATEFHGAPGIAVFYARGTSIVHNEIAQLPYSGVSIGK
jgi:hypothetical protein|eukprot:COSAG01_NODE_8685_length_2697_cov_2.847960_1_plen_449_part_00